MEAVAAVMASEGVDTVFGIPGATVLPLYAALLDNGIKHLTVRHEAGGTHAADGWARATGKVGVTIGTSGPAATNMITGLHAALADSVPIICITGQPERTEPRQEAFPAVDIVEIAKPVTKWAARLTEPAQAAWVFREAFRIARSGRPGPVLIDLPIAVQRGTCLYNRKVEAPLPIEVPAPRVQPINAAVQMLEKAQRPIILAGGGVIGAEASDELRQLAEYLQVPVQVTLMGKGSFPENHPLFAGMAGLQTQARWGNATFLESDLVLAVGVRFCNLHTGDLQTYRHGRTFIHVDIEPTQIGRVFEPDLGIVGHAKPTLAAMRDHARRSSPQHAPGTWVERVAHLRATLRRPDDVDAVPIKPSRVFREIDRTFGPDTAFVTAIGLYGIWSGQFQQTFKPRRHMVCGQPGPLGWEVPAAIGVKSGLPDKQVVAVVGDHSFQFLMEEIAVAAQHKIPFVIVMVNNADDLHCGEGGIDHVTLMDAFGCPARRIDQPGNIADALSWATLESEAQQLPVLVEVMVEREADAATSESLNTVNEIEPAHELVPLAD
ncbi:thiamine pyrophosphate-binding protein [Pseudonocardia alaniniphila]|uniref:Thiamine pyrophosphate-dependent enzyme n=1 Tax=Pseudonocardia alaniniphila TaxID=75291 RepID=A0ABS9TMY1_9PSEU|nr:thiamine pyrophosphate-binding protein [Pseudonocardia alaniniphila]MCH6169887.1 thiamine pyrophosphate-dependent enzyme [Pseudonocardia alaniniphila]